MEAMLIISAHLIEAVGHYDALEKFRDLFQSFSVYHDIKR